MVCTRCGYRTSSGIPGIGLGYNAQRMAEKFFKGKKFKGKKATRDQIDKKAIEICHKLTIEYLEAQRKSQKGHEICPKRTLVDILLRRESKNLHKFRCMGYFD